MPFGTKYLFCRQLLSNSEVQNKNQLKATEHVINCMLRYCWEQTWTSAAP